jgi:hypothetical protein
MEKLSLQTILDNIEAEKSFEAVLDDYSLSIKIEHYVPFACAAIHDGHQFRKELWGQCLHTAYERWYEEDPATKSMIQSQPIVIAGLDSRFEYDLNRSPETAIYSDAWGKQLWKSQLSDELREKSLKKHANFYKITKALIAKLETKFGVCVVYDMHSYNWKRWEREVPTWNLGTSNVDQNRFGASIEEWRSLLEQTPLPNEIPSTAKVNDTFQGNGYFLKYITQHFKNTLVLATEIAKVYCDELDQILYPEVVLAVENHLKSAIKTHAQNFYKSHSN